MEGNILLCSIHRHNRRRTLRTYSLLPPPYSLLLTPYSLLLTPYYLLLLSSPPKHPHRQTEMARTTFERRTFAAAESRSALRAMRSAHDSNSA